MGALCLTSSKEIIATGLGNKLCLGFAIFWTMRLFIQFFGYSSELWKGKRFERAIHILFSFIWLYFSVVFFYLYFSN
jgi:Mn2+/Fe2+ NRAMP family transporter